MLFCRAPDMLVAASIAASILGFARNARAHDDVAFGAPSTLLLSAPGFVTAQKFSRQLGTGAARVRSSELVVSAAASPFQDVPLSFVLTLPAVVQTGAPPLHSGIENAIVGARYRFEIPAMRGAFRSDDDFFLLMAALEPPTGNVEYAPLKGPFTTHFGFLFGVEWRPFSFNAFLYNRDQGTDAQQTKKGNVIITGVSVGIAALRKEERALVVQLALLEETHFHNFVLGNPQPNSGGSQVTISPALVWTASPRWQFFAEVALPAYQGLNDPAERETWRAGIGIVRFLGPLRVDAKASEDPSNRLLLP